MEKGQIRFAVEDLSQENMPIAQEVAKEYGITLKSEDMDEYLYPRPSELGILCFFTVEEIEKEKIGLIHVPKKIWERYEKNLDNA